MAYYLTAVYEEGESDPTNTQEVLLTGIDDIEDVNIEVFPNPADDKVFLNSKETIHSVRLYDYTGQVLMKKSINDKSHQLNISELKPGIYFLMMETENRSVTEQIIKK